LWLKIWVDIVGFWGPDDSTSERILDVLHEDGLVKNLVGQSTVRCSSQAWSTRWRWRWYSLFCDQDMDGCCEVNEYVEKRNLGRADIWSEKVRCSPKMKPRLRAEWVLSGEQVLNLTSCCLSPMRRNLVSEELTRVKRLTVIYEEIC